ncbi:MAG: hypothetical protein GXO83_10725 [Chlorobi bacterium]|nr:hypothetical protein [Chlorobiota bacterium]
MIAFTIVFKGYSQTREDCLMCHSDPEFSVEQNGKTVSLYVNVEILDKSAHDSLKCIQCHNDATGVDFPHEALKKVDCTQCHQTEDKEYTAGVHGQALKLKEPYAPDCKECHGHHDILNPKNPASRTYKLNIPVLCGTCHREGAPVARVYNVTQHNILENYSQGIHGKGLFEQGLIVTATCNDCHGNHLILPHTSPNSSIASNNIAHTCMKCHANIENIHKKVIRGVLWEKNPGAIPSCTACHPPHKILAQRKNLLISDTRCLSCHEKAGIIKTKDSSSVHVDVSDITNSVHRNITCVKCHSDINPEHSPPCKGSGPVDCSNCHARESSLYYDSGHGKAHYNKIKNAPYCTDCHGTHRVKSRYDDTAPTYRANIPKLCGKCHHAGGKAPMTTNLKEINAYLDYSASVHGKGLTEKGLLVSAVCTDCHTTHDIKKESDPTSSVHPDNIPSTCAKCHKGIYDKFMQSVHAKELGKKNYPTCVTCHSAHVITNIENDKFLKEVTLQCGNCHQNVAHTYLDTYHGKAYLLGDMNPAKCSDCHGAHKILNVNDPESSVAPGHILNTCQKCHPSANKNFTGYLTHATHHDKNHYPRLYYVYLFMTILLIGVFGIFGLHLLLWLPRSFIEIIKSRASRKRQKTGDVFIRRFSLSQRVTHLFVIVSFLTLVLTGMMLKFADMSWAKSLAHYIGGVQVAGVLHRFAAIITFGYFGYHLYALIKLKIKQKISLKEFLFGHNSLIFNKQDIKDMGAMVKWFFGKGPRPGLGRWTYWEKFDYFAVFWGVAVIGLSGLVQWFPVFFTRFMPGWIINISQIIHSDEALLAAGFIFTIHFFNTHLHPGAFPMDTVIFTGITPLEDYKTERKREYEALKESGKLPELIVKKDVSPSWKKTIKFFGFIFLITGIILVGLIIYSLLT